MDSKARYTTRGVENLALLEASSSFDEEDESPKDVDPSQNDDNSTKLSSNVTAASSRCN